MLFCYRLFSLELKGEFGSQSVQEIQIANSVQTFRSSRLDLKGCVYAGKILVFFLHV